MNKRDTKAFRKMLKRRGDMHADSKLRGYNLIHHLIATGRWNRMSVRDLH